MIVPTIIKSPGSSPHTRGTSPRREYFLAKHRFIPAHAGNMSSVGSASSGSSVHPRTRGEHFFFVYSTHKNTGSSPHTRGTYSPNYYQLIKLRFIPAHAGNIHVSILIIIMTSVHPRTRGEHRLGSAECLQNHGSSPHTRGTFSSRLRFRFNYRFIPAHAGNMRWIVLSGAFVPVHPRTRGEHITRNINIFHKFGSSPHTRGTFD